MAEVLVTPTEWANGRAQRLQRAIVMHGTSRFREEGARLLAEIVDRTRAAGAAYGWTDALAPDDLAPIHSVRVSPDVRWVAAGACEHVVGSSGPFTWKLIVVGADPAELARESALVARAAGWFAAAEARDRPRVHASVEQRPCARLIELLDAYRVVGFRIARTEEVPVMQAALRSELRTLPETARGAGEAVVEALGDPGRLGPLIRQLGVELDVAGFLAEAASLHVLAYELALDRGSAREGYEAARWAGRAYRKLAEWKTAFGWYHLAQRLAELEGDRSGLAVALDGEGNTHRERGAFPAARDCYARAWTAALESGDADAIAAVGHSMMIVEREAGRPDSAASYGWAATRAQRNYELKARLLVDLGTLLLDVGDLEAARSAYAVAAELARDVDIRVLALDAVAYAEALTGDMKAYARARLRARAAARASTAHVRAQMGFYRAKALLLQGRAANASRVLTATEHIARAAGAATWQVKAAELRESIAAAPPPSHAVPSHAPDDVRQGLFELAALAGVGS